ncbi:ATP-binding protein [Actinomadura formosensis]|uniref:ATP-binding protein n=2 Tax=Actinomadura formosensis TaxID=60706 RepID=UPI000A02376A|nr:ATP-binding protein [Actinomadura formosensis]
MPVLLGTVSGPGNNEMIMDVSWPAEEAAVGRARRCVRGWLGDVRGLDLGDVEVMISELVTNACQHSGAAGRPGGRVRLVAVCGPDGLRIEVTDVGGGTTIPAPRRPNADDIRGRGLMIVEALADRWGHLADPDTGDRTVWVEVARRTAFAPDAMPDGGAHAGEELGETGRAPARCDAAR